MNTANETERYHARSETFAERLRQEIAAGKYPTDRFLPSVRQISHDQNLAPQTILRALKQLESEGLIAAKPRQGFRVLMQNSSNRTNFAGVPQRSNQPNLTGPLAYIVKVEASGEWSRRQQIILETLQACAAKRGWSVLGVPANNQSPSVVAEQLQRAHAFGAVLDSFDLLYVAEIRRAGIPAILFDVWTEYLDSDSISRDEFHGGHLAAEYLIQRGHREIHWFGALKQNPNAATRFGGAIAAMISAGLEFPVARPVHVDSENGAQHAHELLDRLARMNGPVAVLALWRDLAVMLARAARERGMVLGRDLDLVGWCMEEELASGYEALCPDILAQSATVVWGARPVIEAALDRLHARRDPAVFHPIRIQLPMSIRPPGKLALHS